jgi:hypothetical protein
MALLKNAAEISVALDYQGDKVYTIDREGGS